MTERRGTVEQLHAAYNARRFDRYAELLDENAVLVMNGQSVRGRAAFCDYVVASVRELPGVQVRIERVLADSGDMVVVETQYLDPSPGPGANQAAQGAWRLPFGPLCETYRIVEGRIAECRNYLGGELADQLSRGELAPWPGISQLVGEQAALRRVATLVARGASQPEVFDAVVSEAGELLGENVVLLRFDGEDTTATIAQHSADDIPDLTGMTTHRGDGPPRPAHTGRPVRVDSYADVPGPGAALSRQLGVVASAGAPVVLQGEPWGALVVFSRVGLAAGIEDRLAGFAELAATALANAQSRAELELLVDEQSALRRVAELVARGAATAEVLDQVTAEASRLLGDLPNALERYERSGTEVTIVSEARLATLGVSDERFVRGAQFPVLGDTARARVWRTGVSTRIDDYGGVAGVETIRRGTRASVSAPVVVDGRTWGVLTVGSPGPPLPIGTEVRLTRFCELVAAAIANAQSRAELELLADEQGALRRVAELVARGAATHDVFDKVTVEASRLLGDTHIEMLRYERSGTEVVSLSQSHTRPNEGPGTRFGAGWRGPVEGNIGRARVWRTGRAVRIDDYRGVTGAHLVAPAVRAGVLAPITVEGRLWGVLIATSSGPPLPAGTEEKLTRFCELVAAAIANAESRAALTASRARIVASGDEARRRLARDVHDGAQQRLVHAIIMLKQAQAQADGTPAAELVKESLTQAQAANEQLRELAHGIMPAALLMGGLRAGIDSLRAHVPLAVKTDVLGERLPEPVETTAYFVVAEALTNVVKHAGADRARVRAIVTDERLHIEVSDDGAGGAQPEGSGLIGLADRVAAMGGTLSLTSPPGAGTTVSISLPLAR